MDNKNLLREELEQLLAEDIASAKTRAGAAFDQIVGEFTDSLVLFGAGNLGKKVLRGLRQVGLEPVAFADNNAGVWGTMIEGIPVLSPPDAAARYGEEAAFIITIWGGRGTETMAQRIAPLHGLGCSTVLSFGTLFWKYPEIYLPHYAVDLPHKVLEQADAIRAAFELWEDNASRREFVAQIRWRLHLDFDALPAPVAHEIYFPTDLVEVVDTEVFVDCGAFDGDTLAAFLRSRGELFGHVHAFEADPVNFGKMRVSVATLSETLQTKITLHPFAVGERRETVRFAAMGTESSAVGSGTLEVQSVPLDQALADQHPTWIKMDIEGSEPDALLGTRLLVREHAPVLAICSYHLQDHVWRIPLLVREMSDEYRFFLRPHVLECWDLVSYAIPVERLRLPASTSRE